MFLKRLKEVLQAKDWDQLKASQLSIEMHQAEEEGYELSSLEDSLWSSLTLRIVRMGKGR